MNAEAAMQKKAAKGDGEDYTIDTADFDEGAFRALEGLATNGRTSR